ncbi:amidase [Microbaculum marinum]|uniref:Amidase n=1 Tax=Microbaculum marinum TaxID=1764581 RepID=A0AAW9RPN5_9HYPH
MPISDDPLGAFMRYPEVPVAHARTGPLAGLRLGVKDLFDVAGYPTGCGNPTRLAEAEPASANAPAVQKLLDAGAEFVGKTITDELAFSLQGQNAHYGTPVNFAAPERIPGGSSSGSASATAGGLVDFALGTDTGGSVRAPASYCGLFGIRPTIGRIDISGCMPLAPSYDTVGWFARDARTFARVGDVLLGADTAGLPQGSPAVISDALELVIDDRTRSAFAAAAERAGSVLGPMRSELIAATADTPQGLADWLLVFRTTQAAEIWEVHGKWIESRNPEFGPGVRDRFEWARRVDRDQAAKARAWDLHAKIREHVRALVQSQVLVLPTVPAIAPLAATPVAELEIFRDRALSILCIAGIAGLPQVTIPLASLDGAPLGLSIIGPAGSDRALVDLAGRISATD